MVLVFKQYVSNVFTHVYTVSTLIVLTNHMLDAITIYIVLIVLIIYMTFLAFAKQ